MINGLCYNRLYNIRIINYNFVLLLFSGVDSLVTLTPFTSKIF